MASRNRTERLAAELRANLARRKAQARSRRVGDADARAEQEDAPRSAADASEAAPPADGPSGSVADPVERSNG